MALTRAELEAVLIRLPAAHLKAYQEGEISEEDLEPFARSLGIKRDPPARKATPAAPTRPAPRGALGSLADKALASTNRSIASGIQATQDSAELARRRIEDPNTLAGNRRLDQYFLDTFGYDPIARGRAVLGESVNRVVQTALTDPLSLITNPTRSVAGETIRALSRTPEQDEAVKRSSIERAAQQEASARATLDNTGFGRSVLETAQDVAGSPTSALSVIGGPTAALAMNEVYNQEYLQARQRGLSPAEAQSYAQSKASTELVGVIPAGKFLRLGRLFDDPLTRDVATRVAGRVASVGGGEAAEEVTTELAGMGIDRYLADNGESEAVRRYAEQNLPKDTVEFWERIRRTAAAGAMGGVALGGPIETFQIMAEGGDAAGRTLESNRATREQLRANRERGREIRRIEEELRGNRPAPSPQGDLFGDRVRSTEITPTAEPPLTDQERVREAVSEVFAPTQTDMFGTPDGIQPPVPGRVTMRDGNQYYDPATGRRSTLTLDANRTKAQKMLEADERAEAKKAEEAEKKRKSAFQAERRKRIRSILDDVKANVADPAQRADIAAQRMEELDQTFRLEDFQIAPVTGAPKGRRGRTAPAPVVSPAPTIAPEAVTPTQPEAEQGPVLAPKEEVDALRGELQDAGLARAGTRSNLTADDILGQIAQRTANKDKRRVGKMIQDGNLVIVDDASEIPANSQRVNGAVGWYDGQRMYIVANQTDSGNVMGDVLSTLAHENKHANDIGGGATAKASVGAFIGKAANDRIVTKVEALAARGDATAKRVLARARAGSNADTYRLEVPAYLINEMRDQRGAKGPLGRLVADTVSAVRTAAKRSLGDVDINLKDVAYLSDQLILKSAQGGERMTGNLTTALPMILDSNAQGFDFVPRERIYTSIDGAEKFTISDRKARFNRAKALEAYEANQDVSLRELLDHPELYSQMPQIKDGIRVRIVDRIADEESAWGGYYQGTNQIEITKAVVDGGVYDDAGRPVTPKAVLLHEVQHALQDLHPSRRQHFYVADPNIKRSKREAAKTKKIIESFAPDVLDVVAPGLRAVVNEADAKRIDRIISSDKPATQKLTMLSMIYRRNKASTPAHIQTLFDRYIEADDDYFRKRAEAERAHVEGYAAYRRNIAEQEAFNTQEYADVDQPDNPEAGFGEVDLTTRTDEDGLALAQSADRLDGDQQYYIARGDFKSLLDQHARNTGQQIAKLGDSLFLVDGKLYADAADVDAVQQFLSTLQGTPVDGLTVNPIPQEFGLASYPAVFRDAIASMKSPANTAVDTVKKGFAAFGVLGRQLGNLKELADGRAAMYSHRGMNYFGQINTGIRRLAKAYVKAGKYQNIDQAETAVRRMLDKEMEDIGNLKDPAARRVALQQLAARYPQLKAVTAAADEVAQLTRALVKQMLDSNPDPTVDELALMKRMMANTYKYTTRMYAAFQGAPGRARSEVLMKRYYKAKKSLGRIPEKYREEFRVVDNAVRFLIDNDLSIPDDEDGFAKLSMERLMNMHNTWVGDAVRARSKAYQDALANGMTKTDAKQAEREVLIQNLLAVKPSITQTQMVSRAEDAIKAMLQLSDNNSSVASFYRNFAQDRSILEERTFMPSELRELFGEIKDPATRFAVTIAKQGELAARTRMLLDIKAHGIGRWVIPEQDVGKPGTEAFTETLGGETFGPLAGYRTTRELKAAIGTNLEVFSSMSDALNQAYANSDALIRALLRGAERGLTSIAAKQKMLTVVFSLYNLGTNFLGSPLMLMANGVIDPRRIASGATTAATIIWDAGTGGKISLSPQAEEAIKYGILDSAQVQELRSTPQNFVRDLISTQGKVVRGARKAWQRATKTGIETFAMADAWVKIAAFHDRTETLRKFYAAEGISKTDEEIKTEAADQMKDTNITYARTGAVVRGAERLGFTTFMPYFVSVFRSVYYNGLQGVKDIVRSFDAKTPQGKLILGMAGARRLAGVSTAMYAAPMMMKALVEAALDEEDKERIEAVKKLMLPDARFADSFYLGDDKDGKPMFARFSRIDPFGPATDFLRLALDETTPVEDRRRMAVEMFRDLFIANRAVWSARKAALDIATEEELKDKNTKLERMAPGTTLALKNAINEIPGMKGDAESVIQLLDSFTPGMANLLDPRNSAELARAEGVEAEMLGDIVFWSGGRLDKADPELAAIGAGRALEEARKNGWKRQAQGLEAGLPTEALLDMAMEDADDEYVAARRVAEVYDAMVDGKVLSPREAQRLIKDKGKLTNSDIAALRRGVTDLTVEDWIKRGTRLINKKSQQERAEQGGELTPEQKRQINDYIRKAEALGWKVRD